MSPEDARNAVKKRLDIDPADTTFNADIDGFVINGVERLYPLAMHELDPEDVAASPDSRGQQWIDLSTLTAPAIEARLVEVNDEYEVGSIFQHGTRIRVRGLTADAMTLNVYGLDYYAMPAVDTDPSNIPPFLNLAVFYFAQSEFYNFLIGNKRKYNQYMQNGRPTVDNMQDLADAFELRGKEYLEEKAQLYGR